MPVGDGKVRVHNSDLFVEYMQAADWSENPQPQRNTTATAHNSSFGGSRKKGGNKGASVNKGGSFGPGGGTGTEKQREAFMEKQVVREQQFRQKFEVAKQQAERKRKERADAKEKDFEERFLDFVQRNHSLVNEVDGAVRADEAWRTRKRERLFNEWTLNVFQPMQEEINNKIANLSTEALESRRRQMFQSFLDESNRKTNGLFRDIIIESDYDPVTQGKQATMTYNKARITEDPTKNRATREAGDSLVRGLLPPPKEEKQPRLFVSVEMWDRMESTPYGRYSNEKERKTNSNFMKSNVAFDHYNVAKGASALAGEQAVRGKAKNANVRGRNDTSIQDCFKMPTKPVPAPQIQSSQHSSAPNSSKASSLPDINAPPSQ